MHDFKEILVERVVEEHGWSGDYYKRDSIEVEVTSIPPQRILLNNDARTLGPYGLTQDRNPIDVNVYSGRIDELYYKFSPRNTLLTRLNIRTAQHGVEELIDFRRLQPNEMIGAAMEILHRIEPINLAPEQQMWWQHGKRMKDGFENRELQYYVKEDGDSFDVWIKRPDETIYADGSWEEDDADEA